MPDQKKSQTRVTSAKEVVAPDPDQLKALVKQVQLLQLQLDNKLKEDKGLAPVPADGSLQRFYSGKGAVHHDLFKLKVENMTKDFSWRKDDPDYVDMEHCHIFHTVDSSGKEQLYSSAVGGHFHKMETSVKDGVPVVTCVSGPLEWKSVKRGRHSIRVAVPVFKGKFRDFEAIEPSLPVDEHKHDCLYMRSEKIQLRRINVEATKLITENAALTSKPKGLDMA